MSDEEDEYETTKFKNKGLKTTNIQKRENLSGKPGKPSQSTRLSKPGKPSQPSQPSQQPIYSENLEDIGYKNIHEVNTSNAVEKKISKVTLIGKEQENHEFHQIPETGESI